MAKIPSKYQTIFCGGVAAANNIAQFGSLKAEDPQYSDDPDVIQQLDAWTAGWAEAVIDNNAPTIQDMNGLFYVLTRQIAYLLQSGISERNATTTYQTGSLVIDGIGNMYRSVTGENINNALTDEESWLNFKSARSVEVSGDIEIANNDYSVVWPVGVTGPTGANSAAYLPAADSKFIGRRLMFTDFTTGAGVVTQELICDGTKWIIEEATVIS